MSSSYIYEIRLIKEQVLSGFRVYPVYRFYPVLGLLVFIRSG